MPIIDAIDTFLVDLPTIRPHVLAMATMKRQTLVLVRIQCSDGVVGFGEATTIGGLSYGGESPEGIKLAIDTYFAPLLLRADASCPAIALDRIGRSIVGNNFAKCAIETALLDAMGKRVGLPISELLGGRAPGFPAGRLDPGQRQHRQGHRRSGGDARPAAAQDLQAEDRQACDR